LVSAAASSADSVPFRPIEAVDSSGGAVDKTGPGKETSPATEVSGLA
jgi:hypothetical protein